MATLIEKSDLAFNAQLKTFAGNIDNYSTPLGLTAAEVNSVKADSLALSYMMDGQDAVQTFSPTFTAYKDLLRKGGADALGPVPLGPVLPTPPPMPAPNVESRFRKLVQRIPSASTSKTALVQGKPKFFIEPSSGGHPNLRWTKGKFEGVEIWKDSGNGFAKLDRDIKPDYIDKTDLPKAGTTALWKYKMIYLMDDEPIGNWSDEVSVTVFGEV